ncbi:hypothetical protein RB195_013466 [Necator americanus]|uniref:Uncharacterized protein n=1 Tax=Necator americanus TaxID=51031 RepID=A0ABR1DVQ2_NECAM
MLFEVPVDHFPVQQRAAPECQQRSNLLRISHISVIQRQEVSAAVEVFSPSVRRSQFTFPIVRFDNCNRTHVADVPKQRSLSLPPSARQSRQQTKQRQPTERFRSTFQIPNLLQLPSRLHSTAVSLSQHSYLHLGGP